MPMFPLINYSPYRNSWSTVRIVSIILSLPTKFKNWQLKRVPSLTKHIGKLFHRVKEITTKVSCAKISRTHSWMVTQNSQRAITSQRDSAFRIHLSSEHIKSKRWQTTASWKKRMITANILLREILSPSPLSFSGASLKLDLQIESSCKQSASESTIPILGLSQPMQS